MWWWAILKSKRHTKILEIINSREIETQEELAEALKIEGFEVTQATVSRDIKNLKLIKMQSSNGKSKYAVSTGGSMESPLQAIASTWCTSSSTSFAGWWLIQNIIFILK